MRWLALPLLLSLAGCPSSNLCTNVVCKKAGYVCEPLGGSCVPGTDGGVDGGNGGGEPDAGTFDAGTDCVPGCTGATPFCDFSLGRCVACFDNFDCNGGLDAPQVPTCPVPLCVMGACVAADESATDGGAPIPGEACSSAAPLFDPRCLLPRSFSFDVDLAALTDDDQGSCSAASGGGHDAVYQLVLDEPANVTITVTPLDATVAPVVYVRQDTCIGGAELVCKQGGMNTPLTVELKSRPVGLYYLVLDTLDAASAGVVQVTVTFSPPTMPDNETCATADVLPNDGGTTIADGGLRIVDFSMATDDEFTTCNPAGGNDVVYVVTLDQTADLLVTATGIGDPDAGISPVVEVRTPDCSSDPTHLVKCRASFQFGPAVVRKRSAVAGDYYVVVEAAGVQGQVLISAQALPATLGQPNESCASPSDIAFPPDGGYTAALSVDVSDARDDEHGTCSPGLDGGSPEYVYHLRLLASRNVLVQAVPDNLVQPILYLRTGTCESATETCVGDAGISQTATLDAGLLTPGDYYLFVETTSVNSGVVHLTVTAAP